MQHAANGPGFRDYRDWVFVGSSIGLEYRKDVRNAEQDKARRQEKRIGDFHNVYINPEAYEYYMRTGKFPEKTMLAMDVYEATRKKRGISSQKDFSPASNCISKWR